MTASPRLGTTSPLLALVTTLVLAIGLRAQPPGYYASVDPTSATTLRQTLHLVIDDHTRFPYTSSSTDTWDILERAWQDPNNSSRIVDVYRNQSIPKSQRGSGYNREHLWPRSIGFPNDGPSNYPFTDCHMLVLCFPSYNSSRSNKPFGDCGAGCSEFPTLSTNGIGGGSGSYPGNSNWSSGSFTSGVWEVWPELKGDVARAILYADVRYEGGTHSTTGASEPDLWLTDNPSQIVSNSGSNRSSAAMGFLTDLLQWHLDDPVDQRERNRNNVIASFQGNRNPYVDHPEWVGIVYGLTQPPPPTQASTTPFGQGCPSSLGFTPSISVSALPILGTSIDVNLTGSAQFASAVLHVNTQQTLFPLDVFGYTGCTIYVTPLVDVPLTTSLFGTAQAAFPIPNDPNLSGVDLFSQWFVFETALARLSTTQGLTLGLGN